ncbi:MAG TPA: SCO family protein [Ktedonobacteraceae bacterium]|nr:SCO family protein [Ktedonobacteraceae bacterium]
MSMSWRLASRLSVITMALLVVLIVALLSLRNTTGGSGSSSSTTSNALGLQGIDLGGSPAPGFQLTDQFGHTVSLAQFKGEPVIVTFMYTHCPTVCPLIAEKLHTAMQSLGSNAQKVAILVVSVDPKGDTQASALTFSEQHQMTDYWHYLTGTQNQLSPIWSAYAVDAQSISASTSMHTSVLYLIDKQGREQVLLDQNFTNSEMTTDLQKLLQA